MDLKELLGEELYNQMMAKLGDKHKVAIVSDGSYIPKDKFNEANSAKKAAEDTLKERDKQLEELSKTAGASEDMKKEIERLQGENKTAKEKYEADLKELTLTSAIKAVIAGKVHEGSDDIVVSQFDRSKLVIDGDRILGLDEQVKALQTSKAFLFVPEKSTQPRFKGTAPLDSTDKDDDKSTSVGAGFAKAANDSGKAPAAAPNPWA